MSDLVVLQCVNPEALELQVVVDLFKVAFDFKHFPDAEEARNFLAETIPSEELALFFVRRDERLIGMAVIEHSTYVFGVPGPMVLHFYCPKDNEARLALFEELRLWSLARGAEHIYGFRFRDAKPSDEDFISSLSTIAEARAVGSLIEAVARREEPVAW